MGQSIAKYGKYEREAIEEDKKAVEKVGKFFKLKSGRSPVRFLPPKLGKKRPWSLSYQHFVQLDPLNEKSTVRFNCPKKASKGVAFCPLCERGEELRSTGREADRERGYELLPKFRAYAAIVDRNDEKSGVQVLAFGTKLFQKLQNIMADGDFTDPTQEGFDITLIKSGSGKNGTEYDASPARKPSMLSDDPSQLDEWIEAIPDLDRFAEVPTLEQINEMMRAAKARTQGGDADNQNEGGGGGRRMARSNTIDTDGETVADNAEDLFAGQGDDSDEIPY